jgi:hypothetical protein
VSDDDGSITVLTIGLVTVVLMVLVGLAQAGHLFLAQRSLAATCDGAAVAGAQALDPHAIWSGAGTRLDLAGSRRDVARWMDGNPASAAVEGLTAGGRGVLVDCRQDVRLPFTGVLGIGPVTLRVRSAARLP